MNCWFSSRKYSSVSYGSSSFFLTHYLIVSGLVKTSTRDYSSITSESMIRISPGSAKVIDGDLVINVTESTSYHSNVTKYSCEYTIPYHAIAGIKIYESLSS